MLYTQENTFAPLADGLRRLLGERCIGCGADAAGHGLCSPCRTSLPRLPESLCPVCAEPTHASAICGECLARPPAFRTTLAAVLYDHPVDAWVKALKYGGVLAAGRALGGLLAEHLRFTALPDVIVPMPLSAARLRERGFDQVREIVAQLPGELRSRVDGRILRRERDTAAQAGLPLEERRRNVSGAFRADTPLPGLRIALVDDVMTTGATADAAAGALMAAGAASVDVWVVARALR